MCTLPFRVTITTCFLILHLYLKLNSNGVLSRVSLGVKFYYYSVYYTLKN